MKRIAIFGSTGSIGTSTLNVIRENLDLFSVVTLVARKNIDKKIKYTQIPLGIEKIMNMYKEKELTTIDEILEFDKEVKDKTRELIEKESC